MTRRTADERREHVIDAAIVEFAAHGYQGAGTAAIAQRAGISQPYVYALFPDKRELFLAAQREVAERIRRRLAEAAEGEADPQARLARMGDAYLDLIADRDDVLCQLQAWAAAGDPALRDAVREEFLGVFRAIEELAGVSREEATFFLAGGLFLTVAAALGVPREFWPAAPG
jgi:AcrR family transcriptional regulator